MNLPNACDAFEKIVGLISDRPLAVFLDYDGTLTPIVRRPALATLSPDFRNDISQLAMVCSLSVVSGRDLEDVRARVGVERIAYAGSHGFDILDRDGTHHEASDRNQARVRLNQIAAYIRAHLLSVDGAQIEQKQFSVAVHYRNVANAEVGVVERVVEQAMEAVSGLQVARGKMVFDIKPSIDWHKGRAVEWLMDRLDAGRVGSEAPAFAIYIGDDTTDEDAFRVLGERGVGILVSEPDGPGEQRQTAASFQLNDPEQVRLFLRMLHSERDKTQKSAENPRFL